MAKPTYQDATLMLQVAQWGASVGVQEAGNWLWSDQFIPDYTEFVKKYPPGSEGNLKATKVCSFFETLGTLYKHGLLNEDLLFDWMAVSMVWDRVKGYALGVREQRGNLRLYENFEAMANANVAYDAKPTKRVTKSPKK
jgi:hypothetical protein